MKTRIIGGVAAILVAIFAGLGMAMSAQANGYTNATPTSGGAGQLVTLDAGHDISSANQVVCTLGSTRVAFTMTPNPDPASGAGTFVVGGLPTVGSWTCQVYAWNYAIPSVFTFDYSGVVSQSNFASCPAALPDTGVSAISPWFGGALAVSLLTGGFILANFARGRRGRFAALIVPILVLGTSALMPTQPATAASVPTVASIPELSVAFDNPASTVTVSELSAAQWLNTDTCGNASYQWQIKDTPSSDWQNYLEPTSTPSALSLDMNNVCPSEMVAREVVTLTNRSGSSSSTSLYMHVCAAG